MAKNVESPAQEMQRLIRAIGGKRQAGEKDPALMARAARRLNISIRRARTYWYAQPCIISSQDMDRARDLAFVLPLEEAFDAVQAAEQFIDDLRQRLLERLSGSPRHGGPDAREGAIDLRSPVPAGDHPVRNSHPAVRALLNSSLAAAEPRPSLARRAGRLSWRST